MMQASGTTGSLPSSATPPPEAPQGPGFLSTMARSIAIGVGVNGALYYVLRFLKLKDLAPVQSFLLFGALSSGLDFLAAKVYVFGVRLLGNFAQNEEAIQAGQATVGNRLRQRCCKVIHRVDGVVNRIDEFVSDKLGIRSARQLNLHYEIRKVRVPGQTEMVDTVQLVHKDSWDPKKRELGALEIIRFAFWDSMAKTVLEKSTGHLSNWMIKEIGYQVPGMGSGLGAMFGNKNVYIAFAVNFCVSLLQRSKEIYGENQETIRS
jgi:hypothetical protein